MDSAFDRAIFSESTIPLGPGACSFGLPQRPFFTQWHAWQRSKQRPPKGSKSRRAEDTLPILGDIVPSKVCARWGPRRPLFPSGRPHTRRPR